MEKMRLYHFKPYGPFEMPLEEGANIDPTRLNDFWSEIDKKHPGLPMAVGCYIFGIRTDKSTLPWYVGKTEQKSFRFESVQSHKLQHYHGALRQEPGGKALLYLIPRMTEGDKFRKVWTAGSSSVARLEQMLIESALTQNPKLVNERMIKHLTQTVVPGYRNEPEGSRTPAAEDLAALLGVADKVGSKKRVRREDWTPLFPMPDLREKLSLNRSFDAEEYERMKLGFRPTYEQEKWFIYFDEHSGEFRFHRSMSGYCNYIVKVRSSGLSCQVTETWVNADREQYNSVNPIHDANIVNWLIDALLLGKEREVPSV